tara:strand:- start:12 stop:884 length:873 start_codon:yes stop_codon:yes gene_type:complete
MKNILLNSNFAKHSKFDYDFVGNIENKEEWIMLVEQYENFLISLDKRVTNSFSIPKKIHQIWLGNKKLPRKYYKWMKSWKNLNHDWEYKLWTEENIKDLGIKEFNVYSKEINPGFRSDIVRYIILKKFGGLYVDTDFECVKPIPNSLLNYKFVSCIIFGNKPMIANGMMMSTPDYILIENILKTIKDKSYKNEIHKILNVSGPEKLTREYFLISKKIAKEALILPSNYFYPYTNFMLNTKLDKYKEVKDVSIGIHHWEMSWIKGSITNRIKKKLMNYLYFIYDYFLSLNK